MCTRGTQKRSSEKSQQEGGHEGILNPQKVFNTNTAALGPVFTWGGANFKHARSRPCVNRSVRPRVPPWCLRYNIYPPVQRTQKQKQKGRVKLHDVGGKCTKKVQGGRRTEESFTTGNMSNRARGRQPPGPLNGGPRDVFSRRLLHRLLLLAPQPAPLAAAA